MRWQLAGGKRDSIGQTLTGSRSENHDSGVPAAPAGPTSGGTPIAADVEALRSAGSHPILRCFPEGAIIVFDHDLRYLSAGGLGLADVGLSREMLEGHTIFEVFPPEVVDAIEPLYRLALAGQESTLDVPYQDRIYSMRLGPLRDTDGAIIAGMGFTQDVTSARRSERAMRESEDRFRSAFDNAPIGMALIALDGRFEQVNQALCELTGYGDRQLRELAITDITHPDDLAEDLAGRTQLLAGRESTYRLEKRYLTATGGVVWAAKSVSLVCGDDGAPRHFIAQIQDISERKKHEQVLSAERRRLRDAQAIGHVGSWEMDVTAGTVEWSDTLFDLYGLDPATFAGDYGSALDCIHPEDRAKVDAASIRCRDGGEPLYVRYRVTRADNGQLRWFDARGEAWYEGGQLVRLTGAVADVTDQVLAEVAVAEARDAALEASRHKSAFLATMSHEIRTPMNAVIGLTGLLLDSDLDPQQRDLVETVRDSGDALLVIISDILDFSKIESGQLELEQQAFDLWECVEGCLDLLGPSATAKGLDLVGYVGDSPRWVIGDASRLRQVLVNLLSNAIKFTRRGDVLLEVTPQESTATGVRLHIAVTDTGIGIPADRLHRLFKSFSQVDASTTRVYGGTGLGLAISHRLVEAMGGELAVTSAVDTGSVFSFSLLAGRCDEVPPAGSEPAVDLQGRTALIVEDNATNLRTLRRQLEDWGMRCASTDTPDVALALVAAGARYDVALIDMIMPAMDGQQLASDLHELPAGARLPIVLLASMGRPVERPATSGVAATLTKPVKATALQSALMTALSGPVLEVLPAPVRSLAEPLQAQRLRILLAEDNVVNQKVGQLMLDKLGHHVDTVGNGWEALQAVLHLPYDVVLMDVQMPEMDGLEATRRIRSDLPMRRQPRIVAMTASALVEDRTACREAGMDDYLAKPVRAADLAAVLNHPA
ncbi:MAG: PAS domain S-box protein [Geodermatophilaceae bacterium]|nr:PAS domain S-box protein [Geodermatophilaceae bacterium]